MRRVDSSLSKQTSGFCLLHDGPNKGSCSTLLSQGAADRAGTRGSAFRHCARDLSTYL